MALEEKTVASANLAVEGTSAKAVQSNSENPLGSMMSKLRSKAMQYKTWNDLAKALRVSSLDKRHAIDSTEKNHLQTCLDVIQKSIKVTSLQSMVERLESITRQQGLKFTAGPSGMDCFISSDMFYVEVLLETTGEVKDVKIAHHGDPLSCPELTKVLSATDFAVFNSHLEGLAEIYQLNADKKQKTKAFLALQALETDLSTLAQFQCSINDPNNVVHKSPVGILQPRRGGHPMKLTYFISPYDLLDVENKLSINLSVDAVLERGLGHSVTVCIESSTAHKLQTASLMLVKTQDGKNLPTFAAHTNLNSTTLPASFVLHLKQPIPMATSLVKLIKGVTNLEFADLSTSQPLLALITQQASKGELECSQDRGLCVTLPDQHHCYYFSSDLQGVMVSSIPFTHPTAVPQILVFLRQQTLFNTLIGSCIRPISKQDVDSAVKFEVATLSTYHIIVSFEHPLEESLATVELDLKDITNVKCKIYTLGSDTAMCTDDYASKVMQRCLSIPVTMRAVIRKAQGQQQQLRVQGDVFYTPVNSRGIHYLSQLPGYGGNGEGSSTGGSGFGSDFLPVPHPGGATESAGQGDVYSLQNYSSLPDENYQTSQGESYNTDHMGPQPLSGKPAANTMLMSMLSDIPSANSGGPFPFLPQGNGGKRNKLRKRKNTSDSFPGISPKRKAGDADLLDASSSASFDSAINSTYSEQSGRAHISYEPAYIKSEPMSVSSLENLQFIRSPRSSNKTPTEPFLGSEGSSSDMTPESLTPKATSYPYGPSPYDYPNEILQEVGKNQDTPALSNESLFEEESNPSRDSTESKQQTRKIRKIKSEDQKMASEDSSDDMRGDEFKADNDEDDDDDDDDEDRNLVLTTSSELEESKGLTSIKIAKSNDNLKISKGEGKLKQKESRKSSSGESPTRKKDAKKERKRRRMETDSEKLKPLHINLSHDSSLMPPPDSSKSTEGHVVRLNMKPLSSTGSASSVSSSITSSTGSAFSPKNTNIISKKLGSNSPNSSKSGSSPKGTEKSSKVSQAAGIKYSEGDGNPSTKVTLSTSNKPAKHRSSKSGMSPSSGGGLSPNKGISSPKQTTLKLKNINLPASTTITPVNPKTPPLSSPPVCLASISIIPTANDATGSASAAASSKAAARSRKNSLNAVIDKLRVHAGVQQPIENTKGESERRESKQGITNQKNSDTTKSSKYSSSDQFTIKQSSGIKLTVTKTRTTETGRVTSKVKMHSSGKNNPIQSQKHPSSPASKPILPSKKTSQTSSNLTKSSSSVKPKSSTPSVGKVGSPPVTSKTFKSPPVKPASHKVPNFSEKSKPMEPKPIPEREPRVSAVSPVPQTKDISSPHRSNGSNNKREPEPLPRTVTEPEDYRMVINNPITNIKEEESPRMLNRTPSVDMPIEDIELPLVDGKSNWNAEEISKDPPELKKLVESCELEEKLTPPPLLVTTKQPLTPQLPPSRSQMDHDSSSPEDGLVIDYPSAGTPNKCTKSPERTKDRSWISANSRVTEKGITEKTPSPSVPPSSKSPFQISPSLKSPAPVGTPPSNHSVSSSMSRPSPCVIDDDLMDEAVMSLGD